MKESKKKSTEPTFTVEELCENSRNLFGVYPEVVLGSVSSMKKPEFTIEEVKAAIQTFLIKEVM